ncbi:VanZ family protein [Denitromonas iodatirespirans]|uniref:VanZ family protein n=1 Tax=Denitromonas iodatirespirans TaxID=2795389 RepID=A0A944D4T2_DENI1|nr:VanZ family protein [Denitromonas iodatirespirans]MBT0959939.1 VanZ family protein [Denitromonas iodatirespirans]
MLPAAARAAFGAALAAVLVLSLLPVPAGLQVFSWQDKLEHATAFLALGLLGQFAWARHGRWVAIGLLAYGALIEVAQSFTAWRTGDAADWLADALGVGLALLIVRARRVRR